MISSYEEARLHMDKARNKDRGRPMRSAFWRLYQDGDEYVVNVAGTQVGRFLPDNTFMFTAAGPDTYTVASSLSATMHRNIPFRWGRMSYQKYRVQHRLNKSTPSLDNEAPIVFDGLTCNLDTGVWVNAKSDKELRPKAIPERRAVWIQARKAWLNKVDLLVRLGAFDTAIATENRNRTPWLDTPNWAHEPWLDKLYKVVKDGQCDTEMMGFLAASTRCGNNYARVTPADIKAHAKKLLDKHSYELRKKFGVFEDEE